MLITTGCITDSTKPTKQLSLSATSSQQETNTIPTTDTEPSTLGSYYNSTVALLTDDCSVGAYSLATWKAVPTALLEVSGEQWQSAWTEGFPQVCVCWWLEICVWKLSTKTLWNLGSFKLWVIALLGTFIFSFVDKFEALDCLILGTLDFWNIYIYICIYIYSYLYIKIVLLGGL